jgi:hypothetical protein
MISIEIESSEEKRCLFNKPYDFVDFMISDCLSYMENEIRWDEELIMWCDYDDSLDSNIIHEIEYMAAKTKEKNFYIVTLQCVPPKDSTDFLNVFKDYISEKHRNNSTVKKNFPLILNNIVKTAIKNGLTSNRNNIDFYQFLNFKYEDTTNMFTMGGTFGNNDYFLKLKQVLKKPKLPKYVSYDDNVVDINVPILTPKEKTQLDCFIRIDKSIDCGKKEIRNIGIDTELIKRYSIFYKQYPQFFESIY